MLDVIGNAQELGKAVGVDTLKNTFVQMYGLDICDQMVKDHTATAISALNLFSQPEFMTELAEKLTSRTY